MQPTKVTSPSIRRPYEGGVPGYPYFGGYPNYGGYPYVTGYGYPYYIGAQRYSVSVNQVTTPLQDLLIVKKDLSFYIHGIVFYTHFE